MSELDKAVMSLDMSVMAAKLILQTSKAPLQRRLAWFASELERLAGEAYRLADEASDDPGPNPAGRPWVEPTEEDLNSWSAEHTCDDNQPPAYCRACVIDASGPTPPDDQEPA